MGENILLVNCAAGCVVICLAQSSVVFPTVHDLIDERNDHEMSLRDIIIRPRVRTCFGFHHWIVRTTHETVQGFLGSEKVAHDAFGAVLAV